MSDSIERIKEQMQESLRDALVNKVIMSITGKKSNFRIHRLYDQGRHAITFVYYNEQRDGFYKTFILENISELRGMVRDFLKEVKAN